MLADVPQARSETAPQAGRAGRYGRQGRLFKADKQDAGGWRGCAIVIVELEGVCALSDVHVPQCWNYLRVTGKHLCPLINFGRAKIKIRRITNQA
jgi:hypothetical protein